jgi:hypothetical protein
VVIVSRGASLTRCCYAERSLRSLRHLVRMHQRLAGTLLGTLQTTPGVLSHNPPISRRPQELGAQGPRAAKEKPHALPQSRPVGRFASPGLTLRSRLGRSRGTNWSRPAWSCARACGSRDTPLRLARGSSPQAAPSPCQRSSAPLSFRSRSISSGPGPAIYCSIAKVLPSGSLNQATLPSPSSWIPLVSAFSVGSA